MGKIRKRGQYFPERSSTFKKFPWRALIPRAARSLGEFFHRRNSIFKIVFKSTTESVGMLKRIANCRGSLQGREARELTEFDLRSSVCPRDRTMPLEECLNNLNGLKCVKRVRRSSKSIYMIELQKKSFPSRINLWG